MTIFNPTLRFLSDPGHGWLRTPRRFIDELGIAGKITSYSYVSKDGVYVYLEEDCDATLLVETMKSAGMTPKIERMAPAAGSSFIRRLPRFTK